MGPDKFRFAAVVLSVSISRSEKPKEWRSQCYFATHKQKWSFQNWTILRLYWGQTGGLIIIFLHRNLMFIEAIHSFYQYKFNNTESKELTTTCETFAEPNYTFYSIEFFCIQIFLYTID